MAKHIHQGWAKPGDEIPQPIGVALGNKLRQKRRATQARKTAIQNAVGRARTASRGDQTPSPYGYYRRLRRIHPTPIVAMSALCE